MPIEEELRLATREKGFRIGCVHGRATAKDRGSEAQLRNDLYQVGMLSIRFSREGSRDIRLVAYEMPLEKASRGRCIDLFGYDQDRMPWIVELKKGSSSEKLEGIIEQIDDYASRFEATREYVEAEIRCRFHWPDFAFSPGVGKVILAEREFYKGRVLPSYDELGIRCCSFSGIRSVLKGKQVALLALESGKGVVNLKVENR